MPTQIRTIGTQVLIIPTATPLMIVVLSILAGIAYATDQIVDLVTNGVQGIHLYTMNKPEVAKRINDSVKHLFRK